MNLLKKLGQKIKQAEIDRKEREDERRLENIKIKCPFCRDKIPANALRCSHCAADLSGVETQTNMRKDADRQTKIKNTVAVSSFLLIVGLILLVVVNTSDTASVPTQTQERISSDRLQNSVRSMGELMVKDDNKIGLSIWAKLLGRSVADRSSAETIFAIIGQASNNFTLYKDRKEVLKLVQALANQDLIFDEVILQSLRESQ